MTGLEVATIAAIGTAVSAAGAIVSGVMQYSAAQSQAKAAERNAQLARQKAKLDAERQRRAARIRLGDATANFGASGVTMEGSPLDLLADSAAEEELDALIIEHNGALSASGFQDQASQSRQQGTAALATGVFKAGSSLLLDENVGEVLGT